MLSAIDWCRLRHRIGSSVRVAHWFSIFGPLLVAFKGDHLVMSRLFWQVSSKAAIGSGVGQGIASG